MSRAFVLAIGCTTLAVSSASNAQVLEMRNQTITGGVTTLTKSNFQLRATANATAGGRLTKSNFQLTGGLFPLRKPPTPACLADTNGDGLVTPADFNAWIIAFNAQSAACDQNGDGLCTPADFNAWIINFNAGC